MNYVQEIAALFPKLNANTQFLNPDDYTVIAEWEKQEIPLSVVLASINEACRELKSEAAGIDSLSCITQTVGKNFDIWLQETQSGETTVISKPA